MAQQNREFSLCCTPLPQSKEDEHLAETYKREQWEREVGLIDEHLDSCCIQMPKFTAPYLQLRFVLQHFEGTQFIWKGLRWHDLTEISQALFARLQLCAVIFLEQQRVMGGGGLVRQQEAAFSDAVCSTTHSCWRFVTRDFSIMRFEVFTAAFFTLCSFAAVMAKKVWQSWFSCRHVKNETSRIIGRHVSASGVETLTALFQALHLHWGTSRTTDRATKCNKLASLWQCFVYWPLAFTKAKTHKRAALFSCFSAWLTVYSDKLLMSRTTEQQCHAVKTSWGAVQY